MKFLKLKTFGCAALLTAAFTCQAVNSPNVVTNTPYSNYYNSYVNTGKYWVTVTKMGSTPVSNGLGLFNKDTAGHTNLVSETTGYAMIVAALYNDQTTFDRLSATVQAGIKSGKTPSGTLTGLMPWTWAQSDSGVFNIVPVTEPPDKISTGAGSASDADINIALAYIYADNASAAYGWSAQPKQGDTVSYRTMATNYIQAIRNRDFASTASNSANRYVLSDGSDQAGTGDIYNWHPDYSDIRAYQLFSTYDTSYSSFWETAITYTKESWKAVIDFGSGDNRKTWESKPTSADIQASMYNVWLNNATYGGIAFSSSYLSVKATRWQYQYDSDSCRLPIRLMNYVNATENSDPQMIGIANSMLSALGTYYLANNHLITSKTNIYSPFSTTEYPTTQDFIATGMLAMAANTKLTYSGRSDVQTNLVMQFGDGLSGTIQNALTSNDGFNDSLTLWGLTVYSGGNTPLQIAIDSKYTGATDASITTYNVTNTGEVDAVHLSLDQQNVGKNTVKITLTSPDGHSETVMNRVRAGIIHIRQKSVSGFRGVSAAGSWIVTVTGTKGKAHGTSGVSLKVKTK